MVKYRSRCNTGWNQRRAAALFSILAGCASFSCSLAQAIAPPFVSDEEQARLPVIVVARWDKAPCVTHHLVEKDLCKELEVRTEIVVTRVVKGTLKPGRQKILLGPFLGWQRADGGSVVSYTSTEMLGDVKDVCDENLWFLDLRHSWDTQDKTLYAALDTCRGVQPAVLKGYFRAMAGQNPDADVPKLLGSQEVLVIRRALEYTDGGVLPWPYEPRHEFDRPASRRKPLISQSGGVEALLKRKEPEVRRLAASFYAGLTDRNSVPVMRTLLHDDDAEVRGIAVGTVGRFRDEASLADISTAVKGPARPMLACQVIEVLSRWNDERLVPALIAFLENDGYAYQLGDDIGIPALKARTALRNAVGCWFPFDMEEGLRAWEQVKHLRDSQERAQRLQRLLSCAACPLKAELEGTAAMASMVVTNASAEAVVITRHPSGIDQQWWGGIASFGGGGTDDDGKTDWIILYPGESIRSKIPLAESYLSAGGPRVGRITAKYLHLVHRSGAKGWIGTVQVVAGPQWKDGVLSMDR